MLQPRRLRRGAFGAVLDDLGEAAPLAVAENAILQPPTAGRSSLAKPAANRAQDVAAGADGKFRAAGGVA